MARGGRIRIWGGSSPTPGRDGVGAALQEIYGHESNDDARMNRLIEEMDSFAGTNVTGKKMAPGGAERHGESD